MPEPDDLTTVAPAALSGRVSLRRADDPPFVAAAPSPFGRADAERLFTLAFDQAPLAMALHSPNGDHLQVNPAYRHLVGRSEAELRSTSVLDLLHPDDVPRLQGVRRPLLAGERDHVVLELRFRRPDGAVVWGRAHIGAVRAVDGTLRGTVTHVEDVSERVRRDAELAASERRYRTLVENLPATVVRYDRSLRPVLVGPTGEGTDDHSRWLDLVRRVIETGEPTETQLETMTDGRVAWFQARAVPERDERGEVAHVLVVSSDITALKQTEAQLAHRALHDPLTGLANRAMLVEFLERSLSRRRGEGFGPALLFIDLDRFKWVNDALGHRAGDALLVAVARRLRATVRPSDLIARLGGDEFVVVVDGIDEAREPARVAQRLQAALAEPFTIEGSEVVTSASIGIAIATGADADADLLLRDADAAMYLAKANGRNRFEIFDAVLRAQAGRKLRRELALRHAHEAGELEVVYQPEIDVGGGAIVAFEASARWNHPVEGQLQADELVELAEEAGAITGIGGWVLDQACAEAARHPGDTVVRVHLSGRQLGQSDLVRRVADALDASGLEPRRLCLEIPERALMDESASRLVVLDELRAIGVGLGVDDLGTASSSLPFLTRAPFGVLKVDRHLVRGLDAEAGEAEGAVAVVSSIVALGRTLGRRVVADGVETAAQLEAVRRLGCDGAQGGLIAEPAPPAQAWASPRPFTPGT